MSKRWWRAYEDAVDDPKIQRLPGDLFKIWFNLLCLCSRNSGSLPSIDDIAFTLRKPRSFVETVIETLQQRGLIDNIDGKLEPHNWKSRQYKSDSSTERVKQFRQRSRNVSSAVSVTPPETETESETESEKKGTRARRASGFGEFWALYPHKVGKAAAEKAFQKANKRADFMHIMAGLRRYVAKTDDRPWCNPATWLNQDRWDDAPARGPPRLSGYNAVYEQLTNGGDHGGEGPSDDGLDDPARTIDHEPDLLRPLGELPKRD